jgi:arylformamidase
MTDLEAAYDQSKWAANMQQLLARYALLSDAARAVVGEPARLAYGTARDEGLDLYRADSDRAPVVIFVHGGAWRSGTAREYGFPAEMLVKAGVHFLCVDFSTVMDAKGDLDVLIEQVRRAVAWTWQNCASFGGDARRLYLVAHSTGAHLAAMALSTPWAERGLAADLIKGGMLVSGTYDLAPLRHTSRRDYIRLDDDAVRRASPVHHAERLAAPVVLATGSQESPELLRQTDGYAGALARAGKQARRIVGETYNHFEIVETLACPYGLLGRQLLDLMNGGAAA